MKMSRRSRVRLCVAMTAGFSASVAEQKFALAQQNPNDPTVSLTASDPLFNSSFAGGPTYLWGASSDGSLPAGSVPTAGYAYIDTGSSNGTGILRTPTSGTSSFAGDSLTVIPYNAQANLYNTNTSITNPVDYSAALVVGGNTSGQTITVSNLVLGNGGAVIDAGTNASNAQSTILNGSITLLPTGTSLDGVTTTMSGGIIDGTAEPSTGQVNVNNLFVIKANLYGTGLLHVISSNGTGGSTVALNSSNPTFTGGVLLDNTVPSSSGNQPYLLINSPTALGTGTFTIGSMNGSGGSSGSGPTIDNASGAPETLTTNNPMVWNGSFQYQGNNPQTTAPDSLNLGSGGVTLGNSIQIGVYGRGVLSEMGNIVPVSGFGNSGAVTLTINYGGTFEVPSPASLQITKTNISGGSTLAFLATNTSAPAFIAVLNNSAGFNFNFASNTSIGIDTTGYTGTFVLSGTLPVTQIGVNKLGTGTAQLALTNAFAGPTNVSAGTLQLGNTTSLGSVPVIIQPGAVLDLNGYSQSVAYLNGSGGTVTNNGSTPAILTIVTGASSASSTSAAIYSGNLSNGTSSLGLTVNLTTATNNFNASGATGNYSGGTLLKSGTLIVGANTIPANSNVAFTGGSLDFASQPLNTFTMNVGSGSNYNFNAAAGVTAFLPGGLANSSTGAASVNMSGPGVVILGGTNTYTGTTNIASGSTFGFTSPAAFPPSISNTNSIALPTANSSFGIGNSTGNNFTLTMNISGAGGLNKVGTNSVTLAGTGYTYTGVSNVSGGTLIVGGPNVIPTGATSNLVDVGGAATLDLGGNNLSISNLVGTGVVTNNSATPVALKIVTGTSTVGTGWSGNIANGTSSVALVVAPSLGVFNMSASVNSYTGGTNLANGTLVVGAASLPATGTVLFNGGALDFTAPLTVDPSANFLAVNGNSYNFNDSNGTVVTLLHGLADSAGGPSGVTMSGTGTVILAGTNTFTGPITINSGTLAFASPGSFPGGLAGGGGLGVNGGFFGVGNNVSNFSLVNSISGAGGLNKIGTDTVTLTGSNTYTGVTQVSQGTLALGSPNAIAGSSNVSLGSNSAIPNGTLDLNGYSITLNNITGGGAGGSITNSNSSPSVLTLQSSTTSTSLFGSLTGNLSLVVNFPNPTSSSTPDLNFGQATTVANANTYTGTTNLASGVLSTSLQSSLPLTSHSIQFNGGWLQLGGNNQTVASTIDPSAGFSLAPNQQYNIIAGVNAYAYTFNTGLNSPGGSLTLGNYNFGGAGTLILAAENDFSGSTNINLGVLSVANPRALVGTSAINVNSYTANALGSLPVDGTLQINDTSGRAGLNSLGQPITTNVSGAGYYIYSSSTGLYYRHGITSTVIGYAYLGAIQGTAPNGSAGTVAQPDIWAGNIVIGSGFQLTFNGNSTNYIGISGGFNNNNASGSITNPLGGGALKLTGAISGTGNVILGLNNYSDTILAGANTYVGETQITSIFGGPTTVQLGADNAIPASSGLDFANDNAVQAANAGNTSSPPYNFGSATFDLNGCNTSTLYVTCSTSVINNLSSVTTLNNNGVVTNTLNGSTSTLTILSQAATGYQGVYRDGSATAKLALDFDGGVQNLTGTNNYSGGTTVDSGTLIINGLTAINPTGTGNLNVNSTGGMIIRNTSAATLFAMAQSGYNSGNWNGSGIISTTAAADSSHLTAVGMLQPSAAITFEGQTVNSSDTVLKLTYYGDADLNGEVDGSDYSLIDNGYLQGLTGWQNGDFNYDGVIDGSDYTLIDNAYNMQGAQFSSQLTSPTAQIAEGAASAVPEPASIALLSLGALGLLGRRRK